MQYRMS